MILLFLIQNKKKYIKENTLLVVFRYTKRSNHDVYEWAFQLLLHFIHLLMGFFPFDIEMP